MTDSNQNKTNSVSKSFEGEIIMQSNERLEDRTEHQVEPGPSTMKKIESFGNTEELYDMLSGVKRRKTWQEFIIAPELTIRSDVEKTERINLLEKDKKLRNSLSRDDGFFSESTFISKAVIKEGEKVFLQNSEKFLFVEVFGNNMYLAVTWATGNEEKPFSVNFLQYERTYVPSEKNCER
ncbi:MAG: hypothetical protein MHMPM18_005187 [Marteilia pararefringens]